MNRACPRNKRSQVLTTHTHTHTHNTLLARESTLHEHKHTHTHTHTFLLTYTHSPRTHTHNVCNSEANSRGQRRQNHSLLAPPPERVSAEVAVGCARDTALLEYAF